MEDVLALPGAHTHARGRASSAADKDDDHDLAAAVLGASRSAAGKKRRRGRSGAARGDDGAADEPAAAPRAGVHTRFDDDAGADGDDGGAADTHAAHASARDRRDDRVGAVAGGHETGRRRDGRKRDEPEPVVKLRVDERKFERGERVDTKKIHDLKLKTKMKQTESTYRKAREAAAHAELLLPDEAGYLEADGPMERTYRFSQRDVAAAADITVARKAADITLDTYGPYCVSYARNGRHMLLGGAKGHLAMVDWNFMRVTTEFHVGETVHDVCFLHNQTMFAVAQKKYAYIYDNTGAEVHVLRSHVQPLFLEFLPYHFLLASVGNSGFLKYQDVSTGDLVSEHRTKSGTPRVMRQNPWNAVMHIGHGNGAVTLWTPNMSTPAVKMICHSGPVTSLAVDGTGRYMVTAGADCRMKVWDIRAFRDDPVYNYFVPTPALSLDISQRGMLAVGYGGHVNVWGRDVALELSRTPLSAPVTLPGPGSRHGVGADDEADHSGDAIKRPPTYATLPAGVHKAAAPYMRHDLPGRTVCNVRFRPYDDICAIGHSMGMSTMIVPGAGEPNYDSREADPFQSKKARMESEVHGLLDKIAPSMISLDPNDVARVDTAAPAVKEAERRAAAASAADGKEKKKTRGRSKSERKMMKKNANVVTAQRQALKEKIEADRAARETAAAAIAAEDTGKPASALDRFYVKRK